MGIEGVARVKVVAKMLMHRKPLEQGYHSSDVLAHPGEVWEGFIILDDPPIHVAGHGTHAPTISMALDLLIELCVFLLKLESCFLEL